MFTKYHRLGSFLASLLLCAVGALWQEPAAAEDVPLRSEFAVPSDSEETLELEVGEQKVISSDRVKSYSEGTRGVIDIRLTKDNSQFVIVGLRPGRTTLLFLMLDGRERHINITVGDPQQSEKDGRVEAKDNIRLDFYFVQMSKSYGHQLGLAWPGQIPAPKVSLDYDLLTGTFGGASAVVSNVPLPHLDIAQTTGWARIMRQATVVTTNGEKAIFSGGGEVNVLVQSAVGTGVQKISFGSEVQMDPRYDSETGRIELHLQANIAELESDRGTGVPGRLTTNLDTVINLELGQSLVLAGLTARSKRRSKNGLPGLSQIPIVGFLFGTQQQSEEESENVVIIVPTVVDAVSMQDSRRVDEALASFGRYKGKLDEVDLVPAAQRSTPPRPSVPSKKGSEP